MTYFEVSNEQADIASLVLYANGLDFGRYTAKLPSGLERVFELVRDGNLDMYEVTVTPLRRLDELIPPGYVSS